MDVRWGYENVRIKEGDEWKAAFKTNCGLFEPLVMFFRLTNSLATFQGIMNEIFKDLIDQGVVIVYMDDILIFTRTLEEHCIVVNKVLERLQANDLYLKLEKCLFEQDSVEFLGLIVVQDRVTMDPIKVDGITEWPAPTKVKEVQSFLGFANFYRRFIKDFSRIAEPLFQLMHKDHTWNWTDACQNAFQELKDIFTSLPVLIMPDPDKPYNIECDASDFAVDTTLKQQGQDGDWHPVMYLSKAMSPAERNYDIHDKELLAIMRALEAWHHYLEGAQHAVNI